LIRDGRKNNVQIAGFPNWKYQARGIYGLRRDGESAKTVEIKAAATGAKNTLDAGLFKLCSFIFLSAFVVF
jgi:hypothetical protein